MNQALARRAADHLERMRAGQPLIHNMTNYVTVNFVANILLAVGASPVMAHAEGEVEEMVSLASALVLNIGTLDEAWLASMLRAGRRASELERPIVLDPVGAGATRMRTEAAQSMLAELSVTLVRGNASEILALAGGGAQTRGVDTADEVEAALEPAARLARERQTVVVITGECDAITDGERIWRVHNGHPLMGRVTGSGCAVSAVIAAFAAVEPDPVAAAASALACYCLAGEMAMEGEPGPGTFLVRFQDALHGLTPDAVARGARISEM